MDDEYNLVASLRRPVMSEGFGARAAQQGKALGNPLMQITRRTSALKQPTSYPL